MGTSFRVQDHGIGLAAEALEGIFEPFGRAPNAVRSQIQGMGLGLYIARRIVEAHGGKLWAESDGKARARQCASGCHDGGTRNVEQPHRVLVVDDESGIQHVLQDLLDFEGYDVRAASDGPGALRILADWRPEAILLDLMMPVMDGRAFRAALCEQCLAAIPIIVLSGARDTDGQARAIGATAHITKPFNLDDVLAALAAISVPAAESALPRAR